MINRKQVVQFKANRVGATEIAKQMNIGRATVYKILKEENAYA